MVSIETINYPKIPFNYINNCSDPTVHQNSRINIIKYSLLFLNYNEISRLSIISKDIYNFFKIKQIKLFCLCNGVNSHIKYWWHILNTEKVKQKYLDDQNSVCAHKQQLSEAVSRQIYLDISRSFGIVPFDSIEPRYEAILSNVLIRISLAYDYCQGMNLVVASLIYISIKENVTVEDLEEVVFYLLLSIISKLHLNNLWFSNSDKIPLYIYIFDYFLKYYLPNIRSFLQANELYSDIFIYRWFISLFTLVLPTKSIFLFYDVLFSFDESIMFSFSLSLLSYTILNDSEDIDQYTSIQHINNLYVSDINNSNIKKYLYQINNYDINITNLNHFENHFNNLLNTKSDIYQDISSHLTKITQDVIRLEEQIELFSHNFKELQHDLNIYYLNIEDKKDIYQKYIDILSNKDHFGLTDDDYKQLKDKSTELNNTIKLMNKSYHKKKINFDTLIIDLSELKERRDLLSSQIDEFLRILNDEKNQIIVYETRH